MGCGVVARIPPLKWGQVGHSLVAAVAQAFLNTSAQTAVTFLLPESNGSMAAVASWADQIRHNYTWSGQLHYIDTPDWLCNYSYDRDCQYGGVMGVCVDGAVKNYTLRLLDPSLSFFQLNEALKFLIHFIGDIHQPLHCGFTSDEGGNTFKGVFNGHKINLHQVWDSYIIYERLDNDFSGDATAYLNYFISQIMGPWNSLANGWMTCNSPTPMFDCSTEWGDESITAACQYSYVEADGKTHIKTGFNLGQDYYLRNMPIVEYQIAKAGLRLAQVLNAIFDS